MVCDYVNKASSEFGLRFGPDPSTHKNCSFGGMIGNNACSTCSLMAVIEGEDALDDLLPAKIFNLDSRAATGRCRSSSARPSRRRCHHQAVMGFDVEEAILRRLGLDYQILDSDCRGIAGSFGFEKRNFAVSKACADRVLIPRIKEGREDTLISADGFSCREHIEEFTDRKALHLAEVIELALRKQEDGPTRNA